MTEEIDAAIRVWMKRIEEHGIRGRACPPDSWGIKIEHFPEEDGDYLVAYCVGPECNSSGDELRLPGSKLDTDAIARLLQREWSTMSSQYVPATAYFSLHDSLWVVDLSTGNEIASPW